MRASRGQIPLRKVRATPTSVPTMSAMVHAPSASDSVQPSPLQIQSMYRPTPSGVVSNKRDIGDYPLRRGSIAFSHWPMALSLGVLTNSLSFSDCGNFRLMFFGGIGFSNHFV